MQCEACRGSTAVITNVNDDPDQPYHLCSECNVRLEGLALRPVEWFHLAAIHGPNKHLLHDDFYDDVGTAYQPEIPVDNADLFPAPKLDDIATDLPRLIDLAITQWFLSDDVVKTIGTHERRLVLDALIARTEDTSNAWVESTCLQICARCLGDTAGTWVRSRYGKSPQLLFSWVEAAGACLPFDEAWELATAAIAASENVREDAQSLGWFRSERTLDWIQSQLPNLGLPTTQDWGRLAAISEVSWPRIEAWLSFGRPLSLVALDSLIACFHYDTLILKQMQPKLSTTASDGQMVETLERYATSDDVPRVSRAVANITSNLGSIRA